MASAADQSGSAVTVLRGSLFGLASCGEDLRFRHDPRLDPFVPDAQQVQRSNTIVTLRSGARLVAHDLRYYSSGRFHPFGERAVTSAQTVQRQILDLGYS